MLVLSRKLNEEILIGDNIAIKIVYIDDYKVRVGIEAPPDVKILRREISENYKEKQKNG